MTVMRARVWFFAVFFVSFVLQVTAFVSSYLRERIYGDELLQLFVKLVGVYSVPLAIIVGVIFGSRKGTKATTTTHFWLALVLMILWNAVFIWRSVAFGFLRVGTIDDVTGWFTQVSTYSSWLVAGSLSFYFFKQS